MRSPKCLHFTACDFRRVKSTKYGKCEIWSEELGMYLLWKSQISIKSAWQWRHSGLHTEHTVQSNDTPDTQFVLNHNRRRHHSCRRGSISSPCDYSEQICPKYFPSCCHLDMTHPWTLRLCMCCTLTPIAPQFSWSPGRHWSFCRHFRLFKVLWKNRAYQKLLLLHLARIRMGSLKEHIKFES